MVIAETALLAKESLAAVSVAESKALTISEIAEIGEVNEMSLGDQGIINQIETIKFSNIETLVTDNIKSLETTNSFLEGTIHPETNVPFNREIVVLKDNTIIEGVFPEFEAVQEFSLPEELHEGTFYQQEKYLNEQLKIEVENNSELCNKFDEFQLEQIRSGDKPDEFTWHHHQEPGRMQLVDSEIHSKTAHDGGMSIWGIGH